MERDQSIRRYRDKLDKTLMAHDLSNMESIRTIVEKQISKSTEGQEINDNLVQKRTKEAANVFSMLRSASGNDVEGSIDNEIPHGRWKMKEDNQDLRVMYREGPVGTPFHTLLVEGYVDAPLDICMCLTWEAGVYKQWWPQFTIPAFKVIYSDCVKKIRVGEQVSLVRMKFSWPLSTREALIHYVSFDYFQDGLIVVLLNSLPETKDINISTHGFTRDGIPDEENVTRIGYIGGIALQKVSANRSYFRGIANIDIKLDFLPPPIINFFARQIIGHGFKYYKKKVASVTYEGDEDFSEVLKEPLYCQIREALYSENNSSIGVLEQKEIKIVDGVSEHKEIKILDGVLEEKEIKNANGVSEHKETKILDGVLEEKEIKNAAEIKILDGILKEKEVKNVDEVSEQQTIKIQDCTTTKVEAKDQLPVSEIEEVGVTVRSHKDDNNLSNELGVDGKKEIVVSSEVKQALGTLEKVISAFREFGSDARSLSFSRFMSNLFTDLEDDKSNDQKHSVNGLTTRSSQVSTSTFSTHSSTSYKVQEVVSVENKDLNGEFKIEDESILTQKKIKKQRSCCPNFPSGLLSS